MKTANLSIGVMTGILILIGATLITAQDWPQWRGANRDGRVAGFVAPQIWPGELTPAWTVTVGSGDATPALVGDRLYVFARQGEEEVTLCLDAATGDDGGSLGVSGSFGEFGELGSFGDSILNCVLMSN